MFQTGTYQSRALGREQPYGVLLPPDFDPAGETSYPLLVMLHGLRGGYRDWPVTSRMARYVASYDLIVAFPEGGEGWYTNAFDGSARYEDDLLQDFLPHLQQTLPLVQPGKGWGIGGFSMGGYGAVKLALKHYALFATAVSHSGAMEATRKLGPHPVFGDPQEQAALRHRESVFALAELALCRWPTERPFLFLDCGLQDDLLEANRQFQGHLQFIGYPSLYRESRGYHTWPYWDRAFRTVLPEVAARLGAVRRHHAGV